MSEVVAPSAIAPSQIQSLTHSQGTPSVEEQRDLPGFHRRQRERSSPRGERGLRPSRCYVGRPESPVPAVGETRRAGVGGGDGDVRIRALA